MKVFQYRRRAPGRPWYQIAWWDICVFVTNVLLHILFGARVHGRKNIPLEGAVLFVSNHQSFLDPVFNGVAITDRPPRIFARKSLFRFLPFGLMIRSVGAEPITGKASDKEAMRKARKELAEGRTMMVYPEGSRSFDGALQPFKSGIGLLLKKGNVTVLPMGLDGCFDAWPRTGMPRLFKKIEVEIGKPISSDELLKDGIGPAMARLEREVDELRLRCRSRIRKRSRGRLPAPGPGDEPYQPEGADA